MRIIAVHFDGNDGNEDYRRLASVWEKSARETNPNAEVRLIEMPPPPSNHMVQHYANNSYKLEKWVEAIGSLEEPTILSDCDMMILGDLSHVFDLDFDVAETKRTESRNAPINGGMIFLQPTAGARRWIRHVLEADRSMRLDADLHSIYCKKYTGMNQAAMGWVREKVNGFNRIELPCSVYNACTEDWPTIGDHTKAVHVKGKLRDSIFGVQQLKPEYKKAYALFRNWDGGELVCPPSTMAPRGEHRQRIDRDGYRTAKQRGRA